jgi:hypothetical protein
MRCGFTSASSSRSANQEPADDQQEPRRGQDGVKAEEGAGHMGTRAILNTFFDVLGRLLWRKNKT